MTDVVRNQMTPASANKVRPRLSRIELVNAVEWPPAATPPASRASLASTLRASRATDATLQLTQGDASTMEISVRMTPQEPKSDREHGTADHHGDVDGVHLGVVDVLQADEDDEEWKEEELLRRRNRLALHPTGQEEDDQSGADGNGGQVHVRPPAG